MESFQKSLARLIRKVFPNWKCSKVFEDLGNCLKILETYRESSKIFGTHRKSSETLR